MTQLMEVTAAIRAVTVKMKFLVTKKKQENVPRAVLLAMKEFIVTKVNCKSTVQTCEHVNLSNRHGFI